MKKLNVGVDLDGVVYDFHKEFGKLLVQHGVVDEPVWEQWESWRDMGMRREQFFDLMGQFCSEGDLWWLGDQIEGAEWGLTELARKGHRVTFVTERNVKGYELLARRATYHWLAINHLPHQGLIIGPKHGLCFDVMLDDAPHVYRLMESEGTLGVYLDKPWNSDHEDAVRVNSWAEFLVLVDELAEGRSHAELRDAWASGVLL